MEAPAPPRLGPSARLDAHLSVLARWFMMGGRLFVVDEELIDSLKWFMGPAPLFLAAIFPIVAIAQSVPSAPTAVHASTNAGVVSVTFVSPDNDGGSPITGYIATCGARSAGGAQSPITITGLPLGVSVTCTVAATNGQGNGSSSTVSNIVSPVTVPGAPSITSAQAYNTMAYVVFSRPVSDGGLSILTYIATCIKNGSFVAYGPPELGITLTGLTNGLTYACSVVAQNAVGIGPPSNIVLITPGIPRGPLGSIHSRKVHGAAGAFDLPILFYTAYLSPISVESRATGGAHTLVFRFDNPSGAGTITGINTVSTTIGTASAVLSGLDVIVTLTAVPDNSRVTITLSTQYGCCSSWGHNVTIGFLAGDVNNTGSVNSSDISGVKARSGQTTTALNFKFDVNASGGVNSADISAVKARSGMVLP